MSSEDIGSSSSSLQEYVGQQQHNKIQPSTDDDYNEDDYESRRLHLVRTVSSINHHNFDEKFDTISREISRQVTNKEGEFQLRLDEFNLAKILANFVYFAKKQGIVLRKSGITFQDLCVYGVDESFAIAPTVTDLLKGPVGAVQAILSQMKTPPRKILKNLNGFAKPGESVLVLGRPGAGCTTFLKALSGTDFDLYKGVTGDIRYDGLPQKEMLKLFKNDLVYNPELDVHFPHLTVDQTLTFAIACKTPEMRINGVTRDEFINAKKEILATVFGLRHTYHTKVGNDFVRGVSGGERKRVSIAEALACNGSIYCWDNATRGLDASTALEFAQAIRTSTKLLKTTAFVTIYQAGEGIYETFDRVTVLYDGHQVYYGPANKAKKYFEDMGWECPPRQSTAEFLTAITDPIGRFPRAGWENKVPRTAQDFEHYWLNSPQYQELMQEIKDYNDEIDEDETRSKYYQSIQQEKMKGSRTKSPFTISYLEQLKLCFIRSYQRILGDSAYTITLMFASVAQAFVAGSLYYNTPDDVSGAFSRGGVIFFAVLFMSLMGLAEISASFSSRPILMKQKNYTMYHPSADSLSNFVMSIPISIFINTFFVIILYFLSNLARDAGKFFICYLFVIMLHLTMKSMFQAIAAINKSIAGANAMGGILMLASLMYSSYMIQRPSMHPWFKWISYINPVLYAFEAVIASEFHGRKMQCTSQYLTPSGPGYENLGAGEQVCTFIGSVPGQSWVLGDDYLRIAYTYRFSHVWRNLGILFGFLAFFLAIATLGTEYVKPITGGGDKLLFLKGKVPEHITLPSEKKEEDIESGGNSDTTATSNGTLSQGKSEEKAAIADDGLKAKGVFVWKDVDYVIPYEGKKRQLLQNVSGYCVPGTLTALMGESGAGKTTLLNVLAQRVDFGVITGDMLVNGRPLDTSFSRRTGYVQQQDIHFSEVTVRESLQFAARLRRSNDVSDAEKLEYVEKIIDVLDMRGYADAVVGRLGNGLNVEQRKKLSIGVELVAKPSLLLFLDEPTSGLDSQSAWAIVKLLRDLANAGQSILCTIHQPSATLFEEFDRLLLLKKGGIVTYFGDIGPRSRTILDYFERNGARHCDDKENPAEYILEAIGAGATASTDFDWGEIKSSTHSREENSGDENSSFVNYTTDIPLNDLSPYISNTNTNTNKNKSDTSLKYLVNSPFETRPNSSLHVDPGFLETGSLMSPYPKDGGGASPRIANAISRISDRIAGAGGNSRRNEESTDRLSAVESQTSLPLPTPMSEHFTFFDEYNKSSNKSDKTSIANTSIRNDRDAYSDSNIDGLGLYLQQTNKSQISGTTQHEYSREVPVTDYLRLPKKSHQNNKTNYQEFDTMYLFGKSLGIFTPESKVRQFCYHVCENKFINTFLLIILILQVALLTYRQWNPLVLNGYFVKGYNWADYLLMVINVIYTAEVIGKIIAYGFYDDHIMFDELGLPYPKNEITKEYFSKNYISKILKSLGFFKSRVEKKRQEKFISEDNDKRSSSEDSEIREIDLNDSRQDLLGEANRSFSLKDKYQMDSHHRNYIPLRSQANDPDNLDETTPAPKQMLEAKNTFFKPAPHTFEKLNLKRAFFRSSWQRIDFISMVCFWISLFLSINHYDADHHIMLFRALSCLRILRLCNLTTGTTTILTACKIAIPQLIDVSIFIACFWLFFGIIGVQTFKSSLTRHCVWTNPDDPSDTYVNSGSYCGSYIGLNGEPAAYLMRDGSSSNVIKGYRCPMYSQCISGDNPYNGTLNFDNILQSLEIVFVIMSANTFTDIMYYTMDTDNMAACLFFIGCIFVMTVWLINVFIAIIVASFNITRMEVAEEKKKKREGRRIFKIFGYADQDVQMHEERLEFLKNQNVFLKWYYNLEFFFVICVIIDLFVQCFRRADMSDRRAHLLYRFEASFTGVFMVEIILRFAFYFPNWRLFFRVKRNCFDLFLAVITTIIIIGPIKAALGHAYYWLTVFQVMRAYRVVLWTSITRNLWLKIMGNFKAIFDLALFYFILLFLVSIILARYFEGVVTEDEAGDLDFPMTTLPGVFIALYVITSTENWTEILYGMQQYATTTSSRSFGSIFLIGWFMLSNMIILNIFIAVIAKTLEVSEEAKRKQQLLQFIDTMTNKLQDIEQDSGLLSKIKKKLFRRKQVKDELEEAVVNLLLSGTAVNDFLENDARNEVDDEEEAIRTLPASTWKRWLGVNYWRTLNLFRNNPFYGNKAKGRKVSLENFNPANFARTIVKERKNIVSKQNEFLEANPRYNYVFYVIGPHHPLRRLCQKMVKPSYGERIDGVAPYKPVAEAMVVLMFIATVTLVVIACYMTPIFRMDHAGEAWVFWAEFVFVMVFTVEFAIKVIADGFIFTPNAYTRSSWNLIDFVVLLSLWIETIAYMKNDGKLSRIVRGLKALRALRLLTVSDTAKANFHNTMIAGFWKIINAAVISLCLLLPFSIWGLNIFNGRLGYCVDGSSDMSSCYNEYQNTVFNWQVVSPNVYTNPQLEFNRFASSFATLFEIVSLEGWVDLLNNVMASTGVGTPKETNATPFNGFFVVLFNFISIVFILTLFVSVIISNYSRSTGRAYMTTDQISWYRVKKILVQVKPSKRKNIENLHFIRRFCYRMTVERNPVWTRTLNCVLVLHVIALLLECFPSYDSLNQFRTSIYMIASSMFFVNSIMLFTGQGFSTFMQYKWNIFNLVVSLGAFGTTTGSYFLDPNSPLININKLFLVAILVFVIPRSNRLSQLLRFASASLPSLISLVFTWIIVFLVFAIAMNQIFGMTRLGPNTTGNINLRSVPKALILLFRCSFGEGWNYIMEDFALTQPFCTSKNNLDNSDCGNKQYAYILFIAWNIISMYIFLNMFISLILDSFDYIGHKESYNQLIQREEVRKFKRTWQKFDPQGTGYIKPIELPKLLHSLEGALSFHFYTGSLTIPELCKKWIIRNNPNDPYDVTINYGAIEHTMEQMDIPKIRERRKAYEMFIEEALLCMELNNDPGISFTRILLQLPLYTSFDTSNCFNLIDYLDRRLLIQKVMKRLHTKRVYETIATYVCRWKFKKDNRLGIKDTNLAFDKKLARNSYLRNDQLLINKNPPTIFVTDEGGKRNSSDINVRDSSSLSTERNSVIYGEHSMSSGVYYPSTPVAKLNHSQHVKHSHPKLFIEIPSQKPQREFVTTEDEVKVSPFMDPEEVNEYESKNSGSLVDVGSIEEILESSSWKNAFDELKSDEKRKK